MTNDGDTEVFDKNVALHLKQVTDYVLDCERRVTRGEIMELQGLDNKVKDICDAVAELPQEKAQTLETQMGQLIEGLELLADAIRAQEEAADGGAR